MEKKTILLIEDDCVVRDMIRGALERQYRIEEASTCVEAIKQLRNPTDLVLIDYILPDGDGLGVLKVIKEMKPEVPVIMMTAYSNDNLAIKAFRSGVTDYIKKPISFKYLRGKLSEILEGKENGEYPGSVKSQEVFIMDCIAAFIEENYAEDITLDKLASMSNMNIYKFSKTFKEGFGQSLPSYINTIRLGKAVELLTNPVLTITEIAYSAGYGSVEHFTRVFRALYGLPPKEYRRQLGQQK